MNTREPAGYWDFRPTEEAAEKITRAAERSGRGAQALGEGIRAFGAGLGRGLGRALSTRQVADVRLNNALASSSFSSSILNLNDDVAKQTDPVKLRSEYPAKYQAALEAAAGYLPEPQKQMFMAVHADDLTRGLHHLGTQVNRLEGDRQLADTYENLNHLRDANLKTSDPNAHAKAVDDMGQAIDSLAEKGLITRQQAAQNKDTWVRDFATAWVGSKPPEDRLRILSAALGAPLDQPGGGRMGDFTMYQNAIKAIESQGSGGYKAVGPRTKSGDHAYGAYQVIGENLPSWTKEALGFSMTPQQFLNDPAAQDAVFNHRFGSYIQKYGTPQNAASAWFTGRPISASSAASRDVTGTTGSQYVSQFNKHLAAQGADVTTVPNVDTRLPSLLPRDDLIKLQRRAESEVAHQTHAQTVAAKNEKTTITALRADDAASIMATGKEVAAITPERVEASLGQDERMRFEQGRQDARDYHSQMDGIEQLPADEMQAHVAALAPREGQVGFADRAQLQQAAQKQVDQLLKERLNDPAAAADRLPPVQAAAKNASLDRPWSYLPLVNARMAAQAQLGIPEDFRQPITNSEAKQLFSIIQEAAPHDQLAALRNVAETIQGAFGPYAQKAAGYMFRAFHANEELRAQAGIMMQKLGAGQPIVLDDARQFDDAETKAAADAVTSKLQGAYPQARPENVEMLRSNPQKYGKQFDKTFGPGAAATHLGIGQ